MGMIQDEGLGKSIILNSEEKMTDALDLIGNRFETLSWKDIKDIVTVGVWDRQTQERLFLAILRWEKKYPTPSIGPKNLDILLRREIAWSFHVVDRTGGITGLGSMVFKPNSNPPPWRVYNPEILIANINEGTFARISGNPRMGKTNFACVMMEIAKKMSFAVFSNIHPKEEFKQDVYTYVRDAKSLFTEVSKLQEMQKWIFFLDEAGLIYSKADATTRRAKDLDKLARVLGKFHGNLVLIEQRPDSVPTIIQEFATILILCEKPGTVSIELKGPVIAFRTRCSYFPKTSLPYQTYDVGQFNVGNLNFLGMFGAVSGMQKPKEAMAEYIQTGMNPKKVEAKKCQLEGCENSLLGLHPAAKYCCPAHRQAAFKMRTMEENPLTEWKKQDAD